MNITFERIQSKTHQDLDELFALYVETFPPEERRELKTLEEMLDEKRMYFSLILRDNQPVGLIVYWDFGRFIYIEHLALFPHMRGIGIGKEVMQILQKAGSPILLEVEIPYDEQSEVRVNFYNRCGFWKLNIDYLQPPYREGECPLPMMLFSDKSDWNLSTLSQSVDLFQNVVYYSKIHNY